MGEEEVKVKIRKCIACGKEFNKYTRPRGFGTKFVCSDECLENLNKEAKEKQRIKGEIAKENLKKWLKICLITGVIGAVVGGFLGKHALGVLIGLAIGFLTPPILFILCDQLI
ncbi:MAG: hypothetical protein ACFFDN_21795 [Candidatus Hodarchaeota archaeon]